MSNSENEIECEFSIVRLWWDGRACLKARCNCGWKGAERDAEKNNSKGQQDVEWLCRQDWKKHVVESVRTPKNTPVDRVINVIDRLDRCALTSGDYLDSSNYARMARDLRQALKAIPGDDSKDTAKPPVFTIQPYKASGIGSGLLVLCCDGVMVTGQAATTLNSAPVSDWPLEFTVEFKAGPGLLDYVDTPAIERWGG